ncbi:hypothetical protein BQ9231_00634 [Cedratvirus lausannensis]|uniref:Ankyrin repeat n=1 Tax=Cedratvirus lausannensis TaxID=2023205 RepID=A0A285PZ48_9VIRU|nr:hypothetical protein BQ9231_00634 [Cedratvirus lausannensis]
MSLFEVLPNEVLEYIFSFTPQARFPLRQTCVFFLNNIDKVTPKDFVQQVYQVGDVNLAQHYNLPCSPESMKTILCKGHEELFKIRGNMDLLPSDLATCLVQGRNDYITNYLLDNGYIDRPSLVYEACRQNYLHLVEKFYIEDMSMWKCAMRAVEGESLDVLNWIVGKEKIYYHAILHEAEMSCRLKVLRWAPVKKVKKMSSKKIMFRSACFAPNMDMFNFLLEVDCLPKQGPKVCTNLAKSAHVQMVRILVTERGWTLTEEMFSTALKKGCVEMLSCLLELGCPHDDDLSELYSASREENIPWLASNLPLTEDAYMRIPKEETLVCLVKSNLLPESFKTDPDITWSALQQGFINLASEYLEAGYTFPEDICLEVDDSASLDWLIENEVNLCPVLFYRLVNDGEVDLVEKLTDLIDPPEDLLEHVLSLIYDKEIRGKGHTRKVERLERIAEWIRDL